MSIGDFIRGSQVWKSIFRHPAPRDRRNRVVVMLTNVFLHLHPVSVRKSGIALSYTWCMGGHHVLPVPGRNGHRRAADVLLSAHAGTRLQRHPGPGNVVTLGILRELHRWGAHAMVITIWLHMYRVFLTGSYKPPREFNWGVGVILLVLTLLLSFTGYLLPWDQLAIWAITVGSNMARATPLLGYEGPGSTIPQIGGVRLITSGSDARFLAFRRPLRRRGHAAALLRVALRRHSVGGGPARSPCTSGACARTAASAGPCRTRGRAGELVSRRARAVPAECLRSARPANHRSDGSKWHDPLHDPWHIGDRCKTRLGVFYLLVALMNLGFAPVYLRPQEHAAGRPLGRRGRRCSSSTPSATSPPRLGHARSPHDFVNCHHEPGQLLRHGLSSGSPWSLFPQASSPSRSWPGAPATVAAFGGWAMTDTNFQAIITKPDNVPIVHADLLGRLLHLARHAPGRHQRRPPGPRRAADGEDEEDKVLVWPDLVYTELIAHGPLHFRPDRLGRRLSRPRWSSRHPRKHSESVEGAVVFPRPAGNARLLRSVDGRRGAADVHHHRPDCHAVHRLQPEGQRLLHLRPAQVCRDHVSGRFRRAVGDADRAGHLPARPQLELLRARSSSGTRTRTCRWATSTCRIFSG